MNGDSAQCQVPARQDEVENGVANDDGVALAMERIIMEAYRLMQAGQPQQAEYLLIEGAILPTMPMPSPLRAIADGALGVRTEISVDDPVQGSRTRRHIGCLHTAQRKTCAETSCEPGTVFSRRRQLVQRRARRRRGGSVAAVGSACPATVHSGAVLAAALACVCTQHELHLQSTVCDVALLTSHEHRQSKNRNDFRLPR